MFKNKWMTLILMAILGFTSQNLFAKKIKVVTTLPDYAYITKYIGRDKVDVTHIVQGDQDAHFVRPKPSFAVLMRHADLFVTTGLDLELWVPSLMDMANNPRIRSGQIGYVAAYDGIQLLQKPSALTRSEGGLHIYGNPHITTSPLNDKVIADNITIGLTKVSPENAAFFEANNKKFKAEIDRRLFGEQLVQLMGGKMLTKLALSGNLISFLESKEYGGKKLIDYLGGWLKEGMSFRGQKIVTYHKGWIYFLKLFGLEEIGNVEPKPGIPPSPRHIEELVNEMRKSNVHVILSANYFDEAKVKRIAQKVGAVPVIVPYYVGGVPQVKSVFDLFDYWVSHLKEAYAKTKK
ncbi:MAG: zinc ABC transporter substrate-binding protein [Calditrichaeota bacterium]|nr:zinc ABC transporter substrate-binding protein [Calditrichota bacterium]